MLVPLRARGRTLGVVSFALANGKRCYTLADLALAEDLAQRAALAADNARLYREAQDASRAKDEFLAVLSHELRTPLTPVLGWVRMLRTGTLAPEATERALDTVERNTRLQAQLVEDLLDVSRIIAGKLSLDLRPVTLGPIVDAAIEGVAAAALAKSIVVTRRVEPDLPQIEADANRLQQVVANLLSNAVKFTPAAGGSRSGSRVPATPSASPSPTPATGSRPRSRRTSSTDSARRTAPSPASTAVSASGSRSFATSSRATAARCRRRATVPVTARRSP